MTRPHGAAPARRPRTAAALALFVAVATGACSPTFDWREARPEGSAVTMLFPCRPGRVERSVRIADATVVMQLHSCNAGGATFSLAVADAGAGARVDALIGALRSQAAANVAGTAVALPAPAVPGATPNPLAGRSRIDGRLPDQRPVSEHAAWFVGGTRVYQATVLATGTTMDAQTLETFFDALRVR